MNAFRLLAVTFVALITSTCSEAPPPRPNILFISLDSVRYDDLTPYGGVGLFGDAPISPGIRALADRGVVFEQALSTTSWTLPSHMAMMTGLPDPVHGVTDNHKRLDSGVVTLAETLKAAGYATAGYFSGPNLNPVFGFSQGFDQYSNEGSNHPDVAVFTDPNPGALIPVHKASHEDVTSPNLIEAADAFISDKVRANEPFFCFVHFWDPHYDYIAPPKNEARFVRPGFTRESSGVSGAWEIDKLKQDWTVDTAADLVSLYHSELNYTDEYLQRLMARLDELGVAEDTLIVLVSDHGEEFFEHGRWGHQRTLHEEVVRIPMIFSYPRQVPEGARVSTQVCLQDLYATICDLADVALPSYAHEGTLFGSSLRTYWETPGQLGRDQLLFLDVPGRAIQQFGLRREVAGGAQKVLLNPLSTESEIYDLIGDPREKAPIVRSQYENSKDALVQAALRLQLEAEAARAKLPLKDADNEALLSPEMRAELKRLGYL